jgi:hypothetical protein
MYPGKKISPTRWARWTDSPGSDLLNSETELIERIDRLIRRGTWPPVSGRRRR